MIRYSEYIDKEITQPKFFYLPLVIDKANTRRAVLDWFTICQRPLLTSIPKELASASMIKMEASVDEIEYISQYLAVHVDFKGTEDETLELSDPSEQYSVYGVVTNPSNPKLALLIRLQDQATEIPFRMYERFYLTEGMIENYTDTQPLLTDVGKFYLNKLLLAIPFKDKIPYWNKMFKPGDLEAETGPIVQGILNGTITKDMFNTYMNNGYWFGQDGSIVIQTWSEKSLGTDPKILKRKEELLKQYRDQLNDPLVITKIEQELVAMDKEYLKGDVSESFYAAAGGAAFSEQRKKSYIMFGVMPAFDKQAGKYAFIEESLAEGWNAGNATPCNNEIRRGAYGSAIQTAKGGEQSKFIMRIFQEITVDEEDCGTKKGVKMVFREKDVKHYLSRYLTDGTLLTVDNIKSFIGKEVSIRSPLYCRTKGGFCYKCVGEKYKQLNMKNIGLQAIILSSGFVQGALSTKHISSINSREIKDINHFLR